MVLMSQNGIAVLDTSSIKKVYIVRSKENGTCAIMATYADSERAHQNLGTYDNLDQGKTALYYLFDAWRMQQDSFIFPFPEELPDTSIRGVGRTSYGVSNKCRHGKS